jgi:tetratricopeptide (TPR) repeat protein
MLARMVFSAGVAMLMGCQAVTAGPTTHAAASEPATLSTAGYSHETAVKLYRAAKYKQGEALCKAAIAEIEKRAGGKSRELAVPLDDLATIYLRLARFNDARPLIDRAESVLDRNAPADALLLARLSINKGWRLYALQEVSAAEKVFEDGRALLEKHQKGDSLELAELINNVGLTYAEADDPGEEAAPERIARAKVLLLRSWQMRRKLAGDVSAECAESLNNIGMHLLYHGDEDSDLETAASTLKKALDVTEKVYGAGNPETAVAHANMATALHMMADDKAAEDHVRKALAITEKTLGKDHLDRAYELQILGSLQENQGKFPDAEASLKEAIRILELTFGKDHINVAVGLESLRNLYETMGDDVKEKEVAERIQKMRGREI